MNKSKYRYFWSLGFLLVFLNAHAMTSKDVSYIAQAAERGSASAQVLFAGFYKDGTAGYPQNDKLAVFWYSQAAEQGNAYAQQILGDLYEQGKGVEKNLAVAADWRRKAAKRGDAQAQLSLGKMYLNGAGVARDSVLATDWLKRAALQGNSEAQDLYAKTTPTNAGVVQHAEDTGNLLALSAEKSYEETLKLEQVMENLGFAIEEAFFRRPPDLVKLAQDGDSEAQYQMGLRYATGADNQRKDGVAAVAWLSKAAGQGHIAAMHNLAQIYEKGLAGIAADVNEARHWKEKESVVLRQINPPEKSP